MNYSDSMSISEILNAVKRREDLANYFRMFFTQELLDFVPKELWDEPLSIVMKKIVMPWGLPFPGDAMLDAVLLCEEQVEKKIFDVIPLWRKKEGTFVPVLYPSTEDSAALLTAGAKEEAGNIAAGVKEEAESSAAGAKEEAESSAAGAKEKAENSAAGVKGAAGKPAVIICPGGGYENLSVYNEGAAMAREMEKAGYRAFILTYRVKPNEYPLPQMDLAMAIKYVRANARKYGIDGNNLMLMGSSAGGHLCASLALVHEEIERELMKELCSRNPEEAKLYEGISIKPQKLCLNYPVISLLSDHHEGSAAALTGQRLELRDRLSVDLHLDASYPKTFVWACEDDDLVPVSNSERLGESLKRNGVEYKMEIFPTGGHGCGLAYGTSAQSWMKDMLEFMK